MRHGSAFWMAHLTAIEREAISMNAYAKRHRIAVKRLYYWQRKLKTSGKPPIHANQPNTFVALRIAEPVIGQSPTHCTLMFESGMRLEMSGLPAPTWLAALGSALQGAR